MVDDETTQQSKNLNSDTFHVRTRWNNKASRKGYCSATQHEQPVGIVMLSLIRSTLLRELANEPAHPYPTQPTLESPHDQKAVVDRQEKNQ